MKNFFDTAERVEGLRAELWRWEGTPYVAGAAVCGGGGDCVRTADAVLRGCGWRGKVEWPRYAPTGEPVERLLSALGGVAGLARIPQGDDLEAGDVVVGVSRGRGNPHLAIYEGGGFLWHMSSTGPRAGWWTWPPSRSPA